MAEARGTPPRLRPCAANTQTHSLSAQLDEVNPLIFNQDVIVPPEMTHVNIRAKFIKDELRRNEDEFMVGNEYKYSHDR